MPRHIWTLANARQTEHMERIYRLRAGGADLDPPEQECAWLDVTFSSSRSYVNSCSQFSILAVYATIRGIGRKTKIKEFGLGSPEWEFGAGLLPDPVEGDSKGHVYGLLDKSKFERSEVLNHRIGNEGILGRGDEMEGWLLAECSSPVPHRHDQWGSVPLVLSIMNEVEHVHEFPLEVRVKHFTEFMQSPPPNRAGLYGPRTNPGSAPSSYDLPERKKDPTEKLQEKWSEDLDVPMDLFPSVAKRAVKKPI
jgi:hypothetical protein